jgi:8-oxo-dGTP pyrophosphatase MutT (NUDIX family)
VKRRLAAPVGWRRAGRVIALDPADRVLLFRYDDPAPFGVHWTTPGGGLEPGETFEDGARRELAEETGWTGLPLTGPVYQRTRLIYFGGGLRLQRERFFWTRTSQPDLGDVAEMHAHDSIAESRWWTVAELRATRATVFPRNLANLIRQISSQAP